MLDAYKEITHKIVNTVNNTLQPSNKTIDAFTSRNSRKEFLDLIKLAGQRNILVGSLSEASIRLQKEFFLAHAGNKHLMNLREEDLDVFSIQTGRSLRKIENLKHLDWHQLIYRNTKANAVLLCHPLAIFQAMKNNPEKINAGIFRTFEFSSGFETCEMEKFHEFYLNKQFLIVRGHGLIAWGDRFEELISDIEYLNWLFSLDL